MAANEIQTYALLFPQRNSGTADQDTDTDTDTDAGSLFAQLSPDVSFYQDLQDGLQTLSTQNTDRSGVISGFLYVPDLDLDDACYDVAESYVPANVTRQANLPHTDFTLVAIAPWISVDCAHAYLDAARFDPNRGFIFYLPDNSTDRPPPPSSAVWDLHDGGAWKKKYQFPVYAIPGNSGQQLLLQLSLYSGNVTSIPYGHEIVELPGVDPRDYVRLYTEIDATGTSTFPQFWVLILVVLAVLLIVLAFTSACMHLIQRNRRRSLRRRVISGEVNLEALGIKALTVPQSLIDKLPQFTYSDKGESPHASAQQDKRPSGTPLFDRSSSSAGFTSHASGALDTDSGVVLPSEPTVGAVQIPGAVAMFPHRFLPYTQPTCAICLDDFRSEVTHIRELPCGHIFHPSCIDSFLSTNSSLCPMCKKSVLPVGYCPAKITNGMVQRERNLRRLRSRVRFNGGDAPTVIGNAWNQVKYFGSQLRYTTTMTLFRSRELPETTDSRSIPMANAMPARPNESVLGNEVSQTSRPAQPEPGTLEIRDLGAQENQLQDFDPYNEGQRSKCK
ncbi:uncharacterized protein BP5553_02368 [Venustampulla echinocandica]|uniref:RING-type domain-containing protein n=1 Tax=Venustampulla echinocandica TaxID=2656787 RepID=A0A370U3N9_9HELO|nr:uncharacterized protein BP5553_02368 [Venustampulla echinocandica]RDL42389.1 hypothetical protein BP5553_02368 [Venustampulla echinocandica]